MLYGEQIVRTIRRRQRRRGFVLLAAVAATALGLVAGWWIFHGPTPHLRGPRIYLGGVG